MAEALYRKYRPQIFEDVVGQEHIERTLKNAIDQDKVSHAYLFCGPRGTGKTTTARLLAKALLCESGPTSEPDGTCGDCELIASGEHPDVYELDAASRTGVENVREEIIGRVQFAPTRGRYKVYIVDEVHMLSTAAFNALLKTLEEPPSHVVFILATTDPQRVPETIHSRCQRFDFRRISVESIVSRLGAICVSEGVEFEGEALDLIAHRAEGGMRNALTSLEQLIAFGEGKVTCAVAERMLGGVDSNDLSEIMQAVGNRDVAACFRWTAHYVETGADLVQFVRDMAVHVRNLYVLALSESPDAGFLEVGVSERRQLEDELPLFGPDRLARLLGVLGDVSVELKTATNPRLSFEIALTRMVRPDSDLTLEGLAERIEALEKGVRASNAACAPIAPVAPIAQAAVEASAVVATTAVAAVTAPAVESVASTAVPAPDFMTPPASGAPVVRSEPAAITQSIPEANTPLPPVGARAIEAVSAVSQGAVSSPSAPSVPGDTPAPAQTPFPASVTTPPASGAPVTSGAGGQPSSGSAPAMLADPAGMQRVWQSVVAHLKRQKAAYGVLFLNTQALFDAASQQVHIVFPDENEFAFKAVQKSEVQSSVSAAFADVCQQPVSFLYKKGARGASVSGGSAGMTSSTSLVAPASAASSASGAPAMPAAPDTSAPEPAPSASSSQSAPSVSAQTAVAGGHGESELSPFAQKAQAQINASKNDAVSTVNSRPLNSAAANNVAATPPAKETPGASAASAAPTKPTLSAAVPPAPGMSVASGAPEQQAAVPENFMGSLRPDEGKTAPGIPSMQNVVATSAPEAEANHAAASASSQPAERSQPAEHFQQQQTIEPAAWEDERPPYEDEYVPFDEDAAPLYESAVFESAPCSETPADVQAASSVPDTSASYQANYPVQQDQNTLSYAETEMASQGQSLPLDQGGASSNTNDASLEAPEDLQAILAAGFGEGVVLKEVKE